MRRRRRKPRQRRINVLYSHLIHIFSLYAYIHIKIQNTVDCHPDITSPGPQLLICFWHPDYLPRLRALMQRDVAVWSKRSGAGISRRVTCGSREILFLFPRATPQSDVSFRPRVQMRGFILMKCPYTYVTEISLRWHDVAWHCLWVVRGTSRAVHRLSARGS